MKKIRRIGIIALLLTLLLAGNVQAKTAPERKINVLILSGTAEQKEAGSTVLNMFKDSRLYKKGTMIHKNYDSDSSYLTKAQVSDLIKQAFGKSTDDDINVFYYMGHGTSERADGKIAAVFQHVTGAIVQSSSTGLYLGKGAYSYFDLSEALMKYQGKAMVILDCCGSGGFLDYGYRSQKDKPELSLAKRKKINALAAVPADKPAAYTTKQLFMTEFLIKKTGYSACTSIPADSSNDGIVTASELYQTLKKDTLLYLSQKFQVPQYRGGAGDMPLFQFAKTSLKDRTVYVGKPEKISVSLSKNGGKTRNIRWKSSNSKILAIGTTGTETTMNPKKAGTVTVTAYIVDSAGRKCVGTESTCKIKVKKPAIQLQPKKLTIKTGQKTTLKAKVSGPSKKISWSSTKSSVASVSSSGKITAKKAGKTVIYARANGVKASCTVTVKKAPVTVKLSPSKLTMHLGEKKTLRAKVTGTTRQPTWKSSNPSVATVDGKGVVTPWKKGTAVITATVGKKKASCKISVRMIDLEAYIGKSARTLPLKNVTLSTDCAEIYVGRVYGHYNSKADDKMFAICLRETTVPRYSLAGIYPYMKLQEAKTILAKSGWTLLYKKNKKYNTQYVYTKQGKGLRFSADLYTGSNKVVCVTGAPTVDSVLQYHFYSGIPCGCYWQRWDLIKEGGGW